MREGVGCKDSDRRAGLTGTVVGGTEQSNRLHLPLRVDDPDTLAAAKDSPRST